MFNVNKSQALQLTGGESHRQGCSVQGFNSPAPSALQTRKTQKKPWVSGLFLVCSRVWWQAHSTLNSAKRYTAIQRPFLVDVLVWRLLDVVGRVAKQVLPCQLKRLRMRCSLPICREHQMGFREIVGGILRLGQVGWRIESSNQTQISAFCLWHRPRLGASWKEPSVIPLWEARVGQGCSTIGKCTVHCRPIYWQTSREDKYLNTYVLS